MPATPKDSATAPSSQFIFGCGLRRSWSAVLTFGHIQQRDGRWCIVDLVGKHGRVRTIPIPVWTKVAIDDWTTAAAISAGPVFRPVNRKRSNPGYRAGREGRLAVAPEIYSGGGRSGDRAS